MAKLNGTYHGDESRRTGDTAMSSRRTGDTAMSHLAKSVLTVAVPHHFAITLGFYRQAGRNFDGRYHAIDYSSARG